MTRFVDTRDLARLLNSVGVEAFMAELANTMAADFRRWSDFDKSARLAAHSDVGVIELMPIADDEQFAFKYVNGHPSNHRHGLSTVMAFGALADVETGFPTLLSELTLATAVRTGVASALAATVLARPHSRTMGLIGCGAQAEFQAIAFASILGIECIRAYDIDRAAMEKFRANLAGRKNLEIELVDSREAAADGVDILTSVTADKTRATIIDTHMLTGGLHINGVGGDCPGKTEIAAEVLRRASLFVEYEPQSRIEGDIQQLSADYPVTELWRVLSGAHPGRAADDEITVFDSVGFALEDYSMLKLVRRHAERLGLGRRIELVPALADEKNLYSLLGGDARTQPSRDAA